MATLSLQRAVGSAATSNICRQQIRSFSATSRLGAGTFIPSALPRGLGSLSPLVRQPKLGASRTFSQGIARASADVAQLKGAKEAIKALIQSKSCNPILIRLGWHDSGTYDKNLSGWPAAGGATASIRFRPEIEHGANAGLDNALALVEPIKQKFPNVSYADLFQLASATAIELAGGPKIPMRYGRVDASSPADCAKEGNLPDAAPPSPADHLRKVFYRMGLNDQDIVALSGAHTLGRARPDRSGFGKESTKYTKDGPGNPGGSSWTVDWLKFDNSYFKDIKAQTDSELLVLPTDAALFEDPEFKKYAEKYAEDQAAFFADYAKSHKKLSELGSKFDPPQGVSISEPDYSDRKMSAEQKEKLRQEYLGFGGSPDQPLLNNPFLIIIAGITILAILSKLSGAI